MKRPLPHIDHSLPSGREVEWLQWLNGKESEALRGFDAIYRAYQPRLTRYLTPFLNNSLPDSQEVVQVVFIKLWQKRGNLAGIKSLERYLYRMARNATFDFLTKQKTERLHVIPDLHILDKPAEALTVLELKEYETQAIHALSLLPERRRQIFLMSTHEDRSLDEIARLLGTSKSVIKKQLYLATSFLKKYIRESGSKLPGILFLLIFF